MPGAAQGSGPPQNLAVPELEGSDAALPAPEPRPAAWLGAGQAGWDPNPSTGTKRPGAGSPASRRSAACCRSASARAPTGNGGSTGRELDASGAWVKLLARLSLGAATGAVGDVPSGTQHAGCKVLASTHGLALASHTLLSRRQACGTGRARLLLPVKSAFKLAVLTRFGIGLPLLCSASAAGFPLPLAVAATAACC